MKGYLRSWLVHATPTRQLIAVAVAVCGSIAVCGQATAQITPPISDPPTTLEPPPTGYPPTVAPSAAGPYFASPAWGQTLAPNVRFVILTNFNSDAVRDRETGLVWARRNVASWNFSFLAMSWHDAEASCRLLVVGNRRGWRIPTITELQTLVDPSSPLISGLMLPTGHPFFLNPPFIEDVQAVSQVYWTSDEANCNLGQHCGGFVALNSGNFDYEPSASNAAGALCVRGRQ
jgi:hypothetical protein